MYRHEKPTDPTCVKICTGFIVPFSDCTVLCVLKLQTDTALSTMEADIIEMDICCRNLFSIIIISTSLGGAVVLTMVRTKMNVSIQEYNTGALVLARTFPPQITPCSKYYATKTTWFHEETSKCSIKIFRIDTLEYLGELFTKVLPRSTFEYLPKNIMGWYIYQIGIIHPQEGVLRLIF